MLLKKFFFLFLVLFLSIDSFAQEKDFIDGVQNQSPIVTEICIDGLKKTRESYIQAILKKYKNIPASELDLKAIETTLHSEGIFETVNTELLTKDSSNAVLHITVKEKISFIPLPFAAASNGNAMGGLFIMDTNAFGVKDNFVCGGIASSSSLMGMLLFAKPSTGATKPGFSTSAFVSKTDNSFVNMDDDEVLSCSSTKFNAHLAINSKLTEHSKISFGLGWTQGKIDDIEEYGSYSAQLDDYKAVSIDSEWELSFQDWNSWFLSEKSFSLNSNLRFYTDGTKSPAFEAKIVFEQPVNFISPRLRFISQASASYSYNENLFQLGGGSSVGVSILPDDFVSEKLFGSFAGLEFIFAKAKFAVFSLYSNYQLAYSQDYDEQMGLSHGFTAGSRMYLSKVAFPALAFGVAYNVALKQFKYSASFGVSM